jgi:hypothetical protein
MPLTRHHQMMKMGCVLATRTISGARRTNMALPRQRSANPASHAPLMVQDAPFCRCQGNAAPIRRRMHRSWCRMHHFGAARATQRQFGAACTAHGAGCTILALPGQRSANSAPHAPLMVPDAPFWRCQDSAAQIRPHDRTCPSVLRFSG